MWIKYLIISIYAFFLSLRGIISKIVYNRVNTVYFRLIYLLLFIHSYIRIINLNIIVQVAQTVVPLSLSLSLFLSGMRKYYKEILYSSDSFLSWKFF